MNKIEEYIEENLGGLFEKINDKDLEHFYRGVIELMLIDYAKMNKPNVFKPHLGKPDPYTVNPYDSKAYRRSKKK